MTDAHTIETLRATLASDDREERANAVDALAMLGDPTGLRTALTSSDAYVRFRAVKGFRDLAGERITWRLVRASRDPDARVRAAVAEALERRGGWLATKALRRLTRDPTDSVRCTALVVMGRSRRHAHTPSPQEV